ncbi:MAG: metallophosphoesterase [Candidatus Acidiferrales bacterium]
MRNRIAIFVAVIQSILFFGHWFIYKTWIHFWGPFHGAAFTIVPAVLAVLSVSFISATLLAFRYYNPPVRVFYKIASVWLGILNFCFVAACSCWIAYLVVRLFHLRVGRPAIAVTFLALALLASIYGIVNAASIRVKRITVKLPGLPASWRGRVAALVTDAHLGHVRGLGFISRVVSKLGKIGADIVFISGDLFDGTKADLNGLTAPWKHLSPRFGSYYVTGNHEEFTDRQKYLDAVNRSDVRVLNNEKVNVDGLQIVGVHYRDSTDTRHFRTILESTGLDRSRASILLTHVPGELPVAENEGISLQLSGHTHGGQLFPFTWFTSRIFGKFTYGLQRFGNLMVYTSCGIGTWGPPMRVGTQPEIVLILFE